MMESAGDRRVTMVNADLPGAPSYNLSADLRVHWYESGDEESWIAIHKLADPYNEITPQLFADQFANADLRLAERQCYLLDKTGEPIATATAWAEHQGRFAGFGRLHWVAVVPTLQNQGIGKMVVSVACQRLIALGHTRAFLTTSTLRPAAIHLYEKFGFRIEESKGPGPARTDAEAGRRRAVPPTRADRPQGALMTLR
jgi:GNAT superfamily N-acetyltransferase